MAGSFEDDLLIISKRADLAVGSTCETVYDESSFLGSHTWGTLISFVYGLVSYRDLPEDNELLF